MRNNLIKKLPWIILALIVLAPLFKVQFIFFILILITIFVLNNNKKINIPEFFKRDQKNMNNTIDVEQLKNLKGAKKIISSFVIIILLAWLFFASIVIIDAGETGVYSLFGRVKDVELKSGFHLVLPLAKVTKMTIRTEEYTMSVVRNEGKKIGADQILSLTKEGLSVDLDITVLYRLNEEKASDVYKELGTNYEDKIIRPIIRTAIRDVIANYEAKDIYSDKRGEVASEISDKIKNDIEKEGIITENVLLRNVRLPDSLKKSIEEKLSAEQEAQKYDFILEKETKEKERKIIEAEGQKESQRIINESLSPTYLNYLYIKNLENREGTIYVPINPDSGMPIFKSIGQ